MLGQYPSGESSRFPTVEELEARRLAQEATAGESPHQFHISGGNHSRCWGCGRGPDDPIHVGNPI